MLNKKGPPSALKLLDKIRKIPNNDRKRSISKWLQVSSMPQPPEQSK
jgi:hypothetical protein